MTKKRIAIAFALGVLTFGRMAVLLPVLLTTLIVGLGAQELHDHDLIARCDSVIDWCIGIRP